MSTAVGIMGMLLGFMTATSIGKSVKERREAAFHYIKDLEEKGEEALAWIRLATKSANIMFLLYSAFYSFILLTTQSRIEVILVILGMSYELLLVIYRRRAKEKSENMKEYIQHTHFEYTILYHLTEVLEFISIAVLCGLLFNR